MPEPITITLQLSPETGKKLDTIIDLLKGLRPNCQECVDYAQRAMDQAVADAAARTAQDATKEAPAPTTHPADAVSPYPDQAPAAEAKKPEPEITLDMIRQKVTLLRASTDKRKKDGAKDIVQAYAPNIPGLKDCQDKWPEIWAKLTELEGVS